MNVNNETNQFFYKTKNFAIFLSQDEINEIRYIFKRSLKAMLKKDLFKEDTILLNIYIKRNKEQNIKLLCWRKIENKEAYIINKETNEQVKKILYVLSHDYTSWYYQYFDYKTGLLIFEKTTPWIGCPPF